MKSGYYWFLPEGSDEWEIVFVEKGDLTLVRRFFGPTQSGILLSCLYGKWGDRIDSPEH